MITVSPDQKFQQRIVYGERPSDAVPVHVQEAQVKQSPRGESRGRNHSCGESVVREAYFQVSYVLNTCQLTKVARGISEVRDEHILARGEWIGEMAMDPQENGVGSPVATCFVSHHDLTHNIFFPAHASFHFWLSNPRERSS